MSRKHYVMIAKAIWTNLECVKGLLEDKDLSEGSYWEGFRVGHEGTVNVFVNAITDMFEKDNPRFDRERFIEACKDGPTIRRKE